MHYVTKLLQSLYYRVQTPSQVARDTKRREMWQAQRQQDSMPDDSIKMYISKENVSQTLPKLQTLSEESKSRPSNAGGNFEVVT